jgi:hypothetical protein
MAATYNLISSQTINTGTCTFTSITGSYTDLIIQGTYTNSLAADTLCRFNGSTATEYSFLGAGTRNDGTQQFEVVNSGGNLTYIKINGEPNSQQESTNPTIFELFLPQYADGGVIKAGMLCTSYITSTSAPRNNTNVFATRWNNNSAITQIDIIATSGNLVGTFNLYGVLAANA